MPATALEQMILELINRARLDPAAEAARFGIDLNEGVPANQTISPVSKQPLAMNETLLAVARAHSQDMIDRDYFADVAPKFYPGVIRVRPWVLPCWAVVEAVRGAEPSGERSAADRRAAA